MKKFLAPALGVALTMGLVAASPSVSQAAEGVAIPSHSWSFSGPFGHYDKIQLQRGFQVYREVCAGCHGIKYIAFRNLAALGYSEDEIKAMASDYLIEDGPDDDGEMFERAGKPSDLFPDPFPNEKAAAAANGGAAPPDLSLIAKARAGGPDYTYALMIGYEDPPADFELLEGLNYNKYFPGHQIAMPSPLYEDAVTYEDGTAATIEQMSEDVTAFLMWTAEPTMEQRKETGIKVMMFLIIFTIILYIAKRKIWADIH
ncbi:MAG: cytochrome c1 [Pseudomonadota bacterium]